MRPPGLGPLPDARPDDGRSAAARGEQPVGKPDPAIVRPGIRAAGAGCAAGERIQSHRLADADFRLARRALAAPDPLAALARAEPVAGARRRTEGESDLRTPGAGARRDRERGILDGG